jgi:hypothetical protein
MTKQEFWNLRTGDLVAHTLSRNFKYVVTGNYGDRVTAVRTIDLTVPSEWDLIKKVK